MIRDLARKVARDRIAPHAAHYDETESYPTESMRALVESGLFGIWVPEAYGGTAMGCLALSPGGRGARLGVRRDDDELRRAPARGPADPARRHRGAEEEVPSPAGAGEFMAGLLALGARLGLGRREPPHHRGPQGRPLTCLNGSKQWCSHGDHADVITVFATVDPGKRARGITAFVIEKGMAGFSVGKKEKKMGIRCSPTVALHFTDCAVPATQRLGEEGEGFKIAMRTLDMTRPMTGAMAVGIGQAALDAAAAYAKERQQFGQPIAAFQGIQFMLADMAMQVHARA
jgi:alkylation response protein AidB-like acyl-CoA dehydrogenase